MWLIIKRHGWQRISCQEYEKVYGSFGGSFITHPEVLKRLEQLTSVKTKYFGYVDQNIIVGGLASWGKYLAGDKQAISQYKIKRHIDLGFSPEIILPLSPQHKFTIPFKSKFISTINAPQINNLTDSKIKYLAMVRSYQSIPGGFTARYKHNLRQKWRIFTEYGGHAKSFQTLTPQTIHDIYRQLHFKRWQRYPLADSRLHEAFELFYPFLYGHVLYIEQQPVAIYINYKTENEHSISIECTNGGVDTDPELRRLSVGTLCHYYNTKIADEMAVQAKKSLRYSLGLANMPYKERWTDKVRIHRIE